MKELFEGVVSSVGYSDREIISGILRLHIKTDRFDLDPCYSKGVFYKELEQPKMKYDITPQLPDVKQSDCRRLPIEDNSINSIMFDPPFMFEKRHRENMNIMKQRFSMFHGGFEELEEMYKGALKEFYRILNKDGTLVFKCQDFTDSKTTMTHCLVYNWATEIGFYAKDLFIAVAKARIWNSNLVQRHSRKFHSYFWVFKKT